MQRDSVLLLSGGLDSVVLAHQLVSQGSKVRTLHLNVGRLSREQEIHAAKQAAHKLDVPIEIVDLSGFQTMLRGYMPVADALVGEADVVCPDVSFLPPMIHVGVYFAQLTGASELYLATTAEQTEGRPRMREFFDLLAQTTGTFDPRNPVVHIRNPFIDITKAEVVCIGTRLDVQFSETWSCRHMGFGHCGVCVGCVSRKTAFQDAGLADPTTYEH